MVLPERRESTFYFVVTWNLGYREKFKQGSECCVMSNNDMWVGVKDCRA